jgi:hypothetical protein
MPFTMRHSRCTGVPACNTAQHAAEEGPVQHPLLLLAYLLLE